MKTDRQSWWRRIKERLVFWWKMSTPPSSERHIKPTSLPRPDQDNQRIFGIGHKEFITRIQRWISLSPTEGHELVRDLHLIKCRSSEVGAPRSTARSARSEIGRAELILSLVAGEELPQDNLAAEDIRNLIRSAICDIINRYR